MMMMMMAMAMAMMMISASSLNSDGVLLLSFKYSVLDDPLSVLASWNYDDISPCAWNGVICGAVVDPTSNLSSSRVISLLLPNSRLLASLPSDLALLPHLRHLDLSSNFLNGSLPASLLSLPSLHLANLADNDLSGDLSDLLLSPSLEQLNLSTNALVGSLRDLNLTTSPNLTVLSLGNNYISGELPGNGAGAGAFSHLRVLDLSSNLLNGSLPSDLALDQMHYLNLSYNKLTGEIPTALGSELPSDSTVDFSFNNLTGGIPQSTAFLAQKPSAFDGNGGLCGKPLKNLCTIPSTLSNPPNASTTNPTDSPPAFAAIPKNTTTAAATTAGGASESSGGGFKPATIAAIVIGDLGGIALLFVVFLYVYHVKRKRQEQRRLQEQQAKKQHQQPTEMVSTRTSQNMNGLAAAAAACCLRKKNSEETEEETTETSCSSETEADDEQRKNEEQGKQGVAATATATKTATLVTVDAEVELEMETLLKASAYILGATGSTIVYKAVLADGTALAVRRIGESSSIDKLKDFEAQVRSIAKFRHPNLLRIWGFYWGPDEKLLIHDYAPNGSLANISFSKRLGSSPFHLGWDARLRIARGVARGLAFIHEKKSVHGNVKPSNILLGADMEPKIADFGLDRLLSGEASSKAGASARLFGSKRSVQSLPELSPGPGTSPFGSSSISVPSAAPYQAPESLRNLKCNSKCDVYSFGIVLLELMSGRLFSEEELCQWNAGFIVEERNRIVRMGDPQLRSEVEGREEALLSCFKLGFACAAMPPQRRPSMRDVVMLLDRIPSSTTAPLY